MNIYEENMDIYQEIFNKVSIHLLKQGAPAIEEDGFIKYKTESGLKCAIGCLIDEKDYNINMESNPIRALFNFELSPKTKKYINKNNISILKRLQEIHDRERPNKWLEELKYLARIFNLDAERLNQYEKSTTNIQ